VQLNTVVHAATLWIEHEPVPADQSLGGTPHTGAAGLGRFDGLDVGIWEMTPGVMSDVEADEMFVVLSGAATVEFDDGTAPLTLKTAMWPGSPRAPARCGPSPRRCARCI